MLEVRKKQSSKSIISVHSLGLQIILYKSQETLRKAANGERKDRIYMGQNSDYRVYNYSKYKTYAMVEEYLEQIINACLYSMSKLASMRKVKTKTSSCESLHDVFKTVTDLEDRIRSLEAAIDTLDKDNEELIKRNTILEYKLEEFKTESDIEDKIKSLTETITKLNRDNDELIIRNGVLKRKLEDITYN